MSDLISRKKIRDYIKGEINPYGKQFEGTAYELGLKIMRYIDAMDSAYDIDRVVEELEKESFTTTDTVCGGIFKAIRLSSAIEIVKQGGVYDNVCEYKIKDKVIYASCNNKQIASAFCWFNECGDYKYCPYCGKKIKVVE